MKTVIVISRDMGLTSTVENRIRHGYRVILFDRIQSAMGLICSTSPPDLVVLDVDPKDLVSVGALSQLKEDPMFRNLTVLAVLGDARTAQGAFTDAEARHRAAIAMAQGQLPDDHPDVLGNLEGLAAALSGQKRFAEAEPLLRQVLDVRQRRLGADNALTAATRASLGSVLVKLGRPQEAEQALRPALAALEKAYGPDHAEVGVVLGALADACQGTGRGDEATTLRARAARIQAAQPKPAG